MTKKKCKNFLLKYFIPLFIFVMILGMIYISFQKKLYRAELIINISQDISEEQLKLFFDFEDINTPKKCRIKKEIYSEIISEDKKNWYPFSFEFFYENNMMKVSYIATNNDKIIKVLQSFSERLIDYMKLKLKVNNKFIIKTPILQPQKPFHPNYSVWYRDLAFISFVFAILIGTILGLRNDNKNSIKTIFYYLSYSIILFLFTIVICIIVTDTIGVIKGNSRLIIEHSQFFIFLAIVYLLGIFTSFSFYFINELYYVQNFAENGRAFRRK